MTDTPLCQYPTEAQTLLNTATDAAYQETGIVVAVELSDNPNHPEVYRTGALTCAQRHGLVVALGETATHIGQEHPNGSLTMSAVLAAPSLGA